MAAHIVVDIIADIALVIICLLALFILLEIMLRIIRRWAKFPAPAFISVFLDSGFRKRMQPPARIIADSGIRPGMKVLEVGCGSGAFTLDAARAAGANGKVYALDIQKDMLSRLRNKLAKPENKDIANIEMINRSAYELPFQEGSLDLIFTVSVFQEIPDKRKALSEMYRVLKPGGILAISEFMVDPDYPLISTTERMVTKAGFALDGHSGNAWSYTVRFKKP